MSVEDEPMQVEGDEDIDESDEEEIKTEEPQVFTLKGRSRKCHLCVNSVSEYPSVFIFLLYKTIYSFSVLMFIIFF